MNIDDEFRDPIDVGVATFDSALYRRTVALFVAGWAAWCAILILTSR